MTCFDFNLKRITWILWGEWGGGQEQRQDNSEETTAPVRTSQDGAGEKWMDLRHTLKREQPSLAAGWVLGGREMEDSGMTQPLCLNNSHAWVSCKNPLFYLSPLKNLSSFFFPVKTLSSYLSPLKTKRSWNVSQGCGVPKSQIGLACVIVIPAFIGPTGLGMPGALGFRV